MNKGRKFPFGIFIVILIMVVFSSFTIWLIDSWIKYPLFILELFLMIILYVIINGYDIKFKIKIVDLQEKSFSLLGNLALVSFASILLLINLSHIDVGLIQLILAMLCTSLLSGYALLNILGINSYFTRLETVVLSSIFSYIFTGFLSLVLLGVNGTIRILIILGVFIALGSISMLKHRRNEANQLKSFARDIDFLALSITVVFYVLSFLLLYPGFTLLISDPIDHYKDSIVLSRTPELYTGWNYLLAHLFESTLILLSRASPLYEQSALLGLNLLLPITFYIMAKRHLERIDSRIPSLATLVWTFFTNSLGGFAWIYFVLLKLFSPSSQINMLEITADKTWYGTHYAIIGLWHVPVVISLIFLMFLFSIILREDIPNRIYIPVFSILLIALYFVHILEAVIFALFIAFYGLLFGNDQKSSTMRFLVASIIGFLVIGSTYLILPSILPRFAFSISYLLSVILPVILLTFSLCYRLIQSMISFKISFKLSGRLDSLWKALLAVLIFVYVVSLLSWIVLSTSFHTWYVDEIGSVPWFMYPIVLGITGPLSLMALTHVVKSQYLEKSLKFFIVFMAFAFIVGKGCTILNIYYFSPFRENRFIWFVKIPLSLLAAISLIGFVKDRRINSGSLLRKLIVASVIGIIVVYGASTSFLSIERWYIVTSNPAYLPTSAEIEAIDALREIIDHDPKAFLFTPTSFSSLKTKLAAPAGELGLSKLLITARTPEFSNSILQLSERYSHAYFYLHNRDVEFLKQKSNTQGYLSWLISRLPVSFENSEVKIYNVSKLVAPSLKSDSSLVLPFGYSAGENYFVQQLLSQGGYNYTVNYDIDDSVLDHKTLILSFDPPIDNIVRSHFKDAFENVSLQWNMISGSWSIENGSLRGGKEGSPELGFIILPMYVQNFTASFKVKPINFTANAFNYVGFIYGWKDISHYRSVELFFSPNGYIISYIRIVDGVPWANGFVVPENPWSIDTGIKVELNKEYEVKININGTLNEVYIDGKKVVSVNVSDTSGSIGLMYARIGSALFDDFSIDGSAKVNLRPKKDYMRFIAQGGDLIVLNTNGFGTFAKDLFVSQGLNSTIMASSILYLSNQLELPIAIKVPILNVVDKNVEILSNYLTSSGESSPYAIRKVIGNGSLVYVNIYPIAEIVNKNLEQAKKFYSLLGELIEFAGVNLPKYDKNSAISVEGYTREIWINGSCEVNSDSFLLPSPSIKEVKIQHDKIDEMFNDVSRISFIRVSSLKIISARVVIKDGNGVYTRLFLNNTVELVISGENSIVELETSMGKSRFNNVSSLIITSDNPIQIYLHNPAKIAASNAVFKELYISGYSPLFSIAGVSGQDLYVNGSTSLTISFSDTYTQITEIEIEGSLKRDPPKIKFDVSSTLPTAMFCSILLLPIFVIITFMFKESHQNNHLDKSKRT